MSKLVIFLVSAAIAILATGTSDPLTAAEVNGSYCKHNQGAKVPISSRSKTSTVDWKYASNASRTAGEMGTGTGKGIRRNVYH
jgi:hypothetical protein